MSFKIIDQATNEQYQEVLKNDIKHTNWILVDDLTQPKANYEKTNFGFTHLIYKDGAPRSPLFALCYPLALQIASDLGLNITNIMHIKTILQTPDTEAEVHNNPHVDLYQDHGVILYYVNDADGDTFLFNETSFDYPSIQASKQGTFSVKERITPKQGKAVYFDGRTYHASSRPTKGYRIILNFDVLVEPKRIG